MAFISVLLRMLLSQIEYKLRIIVRFGIRGIRGCCTFQLQNVRFIHVEIPTIIGTCWKEHPLDDQRR